MPKTFSHSEASDPVVSTVEGVIDAGNGKPRKALAQVDEDGRLLSVRTTVQKGDTLSGIAKGLGLTPKAAAEILREDNPGFDPAKLVAGAPLVVDFRKALSRQREGLEDDAFADAPSAPKP